MDLHVHPAGRHHGTQGVVERPQAGRSGSTPAAVMAAEAWPDGKLDVRGRRSRRGRSCSQAGRWRRNRLLTGPLTRADSTPSTAATRTAWTRRRSGPSARVVDQVPDQAEVTQLGGGVHEPVEVGVAADPVDAGVDGGVEARDRLGGAWARGRLMGPGHGKAPAIRRSGVRATCRPSTGAGSGVALAARRRAARRGGGPRPGRRRTSGSRPGRRSSRTAATAGAEVLPLAGPLDRLPHRPERAAGAPGGPVGGRGGDGQRLLQVEQLHRAWAAGRAAARTAASRCARRTGACARAGSRAPPVL